MLGPAALVIGAALVVGVYVAYTLVYLRFVRGILRRLMPAPQAPPDDVPDVVKSLVRSRNRSLQRLRRPGQPIKRVAARSLLFGALASAVVVVLYLPHAARREASRARAGFNVGESVLDLGVVQLSLLSTRAIPATVAWTGSSRAPASLSGSDSACLLYLGTANSIVTLFNARSDTTLRLPAATVVIQLRPG